MPRGKKNVSTTLPATAGEPKHLFSEATRRRIAVRKIEKALAGPSKFGCAVADLLGLVFQGIYHLEQKNLKRIDWTRISGIEVPLDTSGLATFDFAHLTWLVVLCHDAAIRVSIEPRNFLQLTLRFHRRRRSGTGAEKHPTIEQAIASLRSHAIPASLKPEP